MSRDYDATIHIDIDGISIGDVPLCAAYEAHDIALGYIGQAKTEANIERARRDVAELARKYRMFMPIYMGKPFKEENNMDIPGKLRDDLKRIYGAADPLDYIEDVVIKESCGDAEINLTLRVPARCEQYVKSSPLCGAPYSLEHWARQQAKMFIPSIMESGFDVGVKAPVKNNFVKPKQVFFNGKHTTLVWPDGEKTIVGLGPDAVYDEYSGFCAAIVKKLFGSSREAQKFLDKVKIVQKKKEKKKKVEQTVVNGKEVELVPMPGTTDPEWGKKHWGPEKLTCLDELSWAEISEIGKSGKAPDTFALGATKVDIMKNGFKAVWRIIGFNHDVDAEGNTIPISWDMQTIYRDEYPMYDDDHDGGGWKNTVWREKLNGEIFDLLSAELQAVIVPCVKQTADSLGVIVDTVDKLWAKSERELFGRSIYSYPGEGKWYDYYRQEDVCYAVEDEDGDRRWAYLRSAYYAGGGGFCGVGADGSASADAAYFSYGLAPGFCC